MIRNVILIFIALVLIGLAALFASRLSKEPSDQIHVFGNIEVTEVDVSFKLPGKVEKRFVDEGELLYAGQLVAELEKVELLSQKDIGLAKLAQAEANFKEIKTGSLPREIVQAGAKLTDAETDFSRLKDDYTRQEALLRDEVISQREFDVSKSSYRTSEANLKQALDSYELLRGIIQEERVQAAQSQINEASGNLAIANKHLEDASLKSPLSGWVLSKNVESGEVVQAGTPIVTVGNLNDIWFRAYVDETDLGKIKLNQKVRVTTDSYPNKTYEGYISFISKQAEFTPKNVETKKERVKLVYRIKVYLKNPAFELRPGMPAEGVIQLNEYTRN